MEAPDYNSDSEKSVPWQGAILQTSPKPSDAEIFEKHKQDRAAAIAAIPTYDESVKITLDLLGVYEPIWAVVPGTPHVQYWADFPGRVRRMLREDGGDVSDDCGDLTPAEIRRICAHTSKIEGEIRLRLTSEAVQALRNVRGRCWALVETLNHARVCVSLMAGNYDYGLDHCRTEYYPILYAHQIEQRRGDQ